MRHKDFEPAMLCFPGLKRGSAVAWRRYRSQDMLDPAPFPSIRSVERGTAAAFPRFAAESASAAVLLAAALCYRAAHGIV